MQFGPFDGGGLVVTVTVGVGVLEDDGALVVGVPLADTVTVVVEPGAVTVAVSVLVVPGAVTVAVGVTTTGSGHEIVRVVPSSV